MYIVKIVPCGRLIKVRYHYLRHYTKNWRRYSFVRAINHEKAIYCHAN